VAGHLPLDGEYGLLDLFDLRLTASPFSDKVYPLGSRSKSRTCNFLSKAEMRRLTVATPTLSERAASVTLPVRTTARKYLRSSHLGESPTRERKVRGQARRQHRSCRGQSLLEIGDDVVLVFQPNREANDVGPGASFDFLCVGELAMRGRGRMDDQRARVADIGEVRE
jgi:hypothetical protein